MGVPVASTTLTPNPATGTTTTDGTEQTLASGTAAGSYQLDLDASAMADGDQLEVRVYKKVISGGTEHLVDGPFTLTNVQAKPIQEYGPYSCIASSDIKFTIKRVLGTDRAYPWTVIGYTE